MLFSRKCPIFQIYFYCPQWECGFCKLGINRHFRPPSQIRPQHRPAACESEDFEDMSPRIFRILCSRRPAFRVRYEHLSSSNLHSNRDAAVSHSSAQTSRESQYASDSRPCISGRRCTESAPSPCKHREPFQRLRFRSCQGV